MLTVLMSTEAQPSTPRQEVPPAELHSVQPGEKQSNGPPIAFNTQLPRRRHRRSSSLVELFSRILPSHRPEKGHTLRHDSEIQDTQTPEIDKDLLTPLHKKINSSYNDANLPFKSKTWSSPHDNQPVGCQQHKRGILKRVFGSMRSSKGDSKETSGKVRDGSAAQPLNMPREQIRFQPGPSELVRPLKTHRLALTDARDYSNEKEITEAQQIFEDKKARREQRRSLRESGDFLGVQGANPRTGYWDVSDATSSSDPSLMSEEMRQMLAKQARDVAEKRTRFEEAQQKQQSELQRVQALTEERKRDKFDQKKRELRMRQRGKEKWRLSENGWSSVAEPELSPIVQSLAGSPSAELPPADRLFPMPSPDNPAPYTGARPIEQWDYFGHRNISSPLVRDHSSQYNGAVLAGSRPDIISPKPVGCSTRRTIDGSTSTIVHSTIAPAFPSRSASNHQEREGYAAAKVKSAQTIQELDSTATAAAPLPGEHQSFLGQIPPGLELQDQPGIRPIAISYQSVSTSQGPVHRLLAPSMMSLKDINIKQGKCITSLNELPPVSIKDPIAARTPLRPQVTKACFLVWLPPTITQAQTDQPPSSTSTFTTTITGSAPLQPLPYQVDGVSDNTSDIRARGPVLPYKLNRTTLRGNSPLKALPSEPQSSESPALPADTGISSEHQLTPTKHRIARLCRGASTADERIEMRTIRTSTSTSPRRLPREEETARSAAQVAFQHLRHNLVPLRMTGLSDCTLKAERVKRQANPLAKARPGASGDRLSVQYPHPEPKSKLTPKAKVDTIRMVVANGRNQPVGKREKAGTFPTKQAPTPLYQPMSMRQAVADLLRQTWVLVEPVFNPESSLRMRYD